MTRQQAVFFSIIDQFQEASGAMEAMENSAGEMAKAQGIYMDSAKAHVDVFKAAWQDLAGTLADSSFIKGFVDSGTTLLNLLDDLASALGAFPTLIGGVAAAMSAIKGRGELSNQFHLPIILGSEYAPEVPSGNTNETALQFAYHISYRTIYIGA